MEGFDINGIKETWGRDGINDADLTIEGFSMFRSDQLHLTAGGLTSYASERLEATLHQGQMNIEFRESLWCNVIMN